MSKPLNDAAQEKMFARNFLIKYGQDQNAMNYVGIKVRLWLDKSPVENYKRSRGI